MNNFEDNNRENKPEKQPAANEERRGEAPKVEQRTYYNESYARNGNYQPARKSGMPTWLRVLIITILVCILISYLMGSCVSTIVESFNSSLETLGGTYQTKDVTVKDAKGEYIGVLHIENTISEGGNSSLYDHEYLLESIDAMANDEKNKGIVLYLNTPGGSVYASDELYLALKAYQNMTKRPVYAAMQSICASGGYYISANADKIYANRNCWTGSIGVTIGTLYDVSELLDKLGVKTNTITSGKNKALGSTTEKLTKEQREILQSLVDEAYEQFVGIVADGRGMKLSVVKKIADGRIYSALQAKEKGLVDEIGTYADCVQAMKTDYSLGADCTVLDFISADETSFRNILGVMSENIGNVKSGTTLTAAQIQELIALNNRLEISYIAEELN